MTFEPNAYDKIEAILEALDEAMDENKTVLKEAAEAEAEYKVSFAKAFRAAAGNPELKTQDARNAQATIDTEEKLKDRLTKTAVADAQKARLRALSDQLSGYQTLANASRGV